MPDKSKTYNLIRYLRIAAVVGVFFGLLLVASVRVDRISKGIATSIERLTFISGVSLIGISAAVLVAMIGVNALLKRTSKK